MNKIKHLTYIILIAALPSPLMAQACSCGGAPLMGSLDLPSTPAGSWQFALTYEFNSIDDVYFGSDEIDSDERERSVHSGVLEIGYGITERISVSTMITFLQQERNSGLAGGTGESLQTRGIGDGIIMLKYDLILLSILSQTQLSVGGGVKLPLGQSDIKSNGFLLAADMQPGTGSWDGVLWGYAYQGLERSSKLGLFASTLFRFNGSNARFGPQNQGYKFGNELIFKSGANWSPLSLMDYTLALRYRSVRADKFSGVDVPNSGGKWLDLEPGVNFSLSNALRLRASGRIPVYRELEGTQLTTSYTLSLTLFYSILNNEREFEI
ncbi:MAG: hypothetical protein GF310_14630 [candidate division Zixibacteria bacterium]|nr:hypothetical protein [candidate division Zixibacteria bacterium]